MARLNIATKTTGDKLAADEFNQVVKAINDIPDNSTELSTLKESVDTLQLRKVDTVTGKGLSTNDYTDEDKERLNELNSRVEEIAGIVDGVVITDAERKTGLFRLGSTSYDLYQLSVSLTDLPTIVGGTKNYTISDEPLGDNLYLSATGLVVSDAHADNFYNNTHSVNKLSVDANLNTNIEIKCNDTVSGAMKGIVTVQYIKMNFERIEFKLTNIAAGIDKSAISLTFPNLKYDKTFAYSLIVDDCRIDSNKFFFQINKKWIDTEKFQHFDQPRTTGYIPEKTLNYTDGFGVDRRFVYGVAILPGGRNGYVPNFMDPPNYPDKNYPYLVWKEVNKILDFGNEIHLHDVNATDVKNIEDLLAGIDEAQQVTLKKIGNGIKVMVRPNGNDTYIEASMLHPDIVFMTTEGGNSTISSLGSSVDLNKEIIWRRNCDNTTAENLMSKIIENSAIQDKWMCDFTHVPTDGMLEGLVAFNNTYGKDGNDSVWFASIDEVYEYRFIRQFTKFKKVILGDEVRFIMFVPKVKYGRHLDFTIQLINISSVTDGIAPVSDNIYGLSYGTKNGKFLVNINANKRLLDCAERYTSKFESSLLDDDKVDALYFVQQLRSDLKASFMDRLSVGEKPPVLNAVSINAGASSAFDKAVTVSVDAIGAIGFYKISESADMAGIEWVEGTANNIAFNLSDGFGIKTVYVQLKNDYGESAIKSTTITYAERPVVLYTVTGQSNNASYGTVTPATQEVSPGGSATVNAQAKAGYVIDTWSGATGSGSGTVSGSATAANLQANKTIVCNFKQEETPPPIPSEEDKWILSAGWTYADTGFDSETGIFKMAGNSVYKDIHTTSNVKKGQALYNSNGSGITANMDKLTDKRGYITGDNSGIYPDKYMANLMSPYVSTSGDLPGLTVSFQNIPNGTYSFKVFSSTINSAFLTGGTGTIKYSVNGAVIEKPDIFPLNNSTEFVVFESVDVTDGTIIFKATSSGNNKLNPVNVIEIEKL